MGIRIHKSLGYGLAKVKFGKDPLFNESFWKICNEDPDIKPILIDFCEKNKDDLLGDLSFYNWLKGTGWYTPEDGAPKTLGIDNFMHYSSMPDDLYEKEYPIIFGCNKFNSDWHRYDDIIDYIEAGREMKDIYKPIERCIYPYVNYIYKNSGEIVKGAEAFLAHKNPNMTPAISPDVLVFCKALNVFKDPLTLYTLSPALYTYWS